MSVLSVASSNGDVKSRRSPISYFLMCIALIAVSFVSELPVKAQDSDHAPGEGPAFAPRAFSESASVPEGLRVVVDERGRLTHSVDAAGSTETTSQVTSVKPAGATLRRATLFVASTGFTGPAQGAVLLDGLDVPLADGITSSIASTNYRADVTDMVREKVDSAAPGPVTFDVTETASSSIDGVILSIIFDDPAVTSDRSVTLLFGAMQTSGDRFVLRMSEPLAPDSPDSELEMSLGVSYGYQAGATGQYSTVDVNGRRLTAAAGGEDDGQSANGALITAGGVGDDPANPPDPQRIPDVPTYDDELYDLEPFVNSGDTSIVVETSNPSNDDNVFFAAFTTNPPVKSVSVPSDDEPSNYVALGDSYSSGEGNPPFDEGTDVKKNRCHRSPDAWPRLLSVARERHLACSGAVMKDLLKRSKKSAPDDTTQIARLTKLNEDEEVDVVTITMGGNDLGFAAKLGDCFIRECFAHPSKDRKDIDKVTDRLRDEMYPAVRNAAPAADVFVVGYPQLFPDDIRETTRCGWLTPKELRRAKELQAYLDTKMSQAAASIGFTYISVLDVLDGHELCSADPWLHDLGRNGGQLRGHPLETDTKHGQSAIALEVAAHSRGHLIYTILPRF